MISTKPHVQHLIALLRAWGVREVVLSPGSRNAPLIHAFSQTQGFCCRVVADERDAAFQALGMIEALAWPVAICCTSGSALLNYAPAVAEAWYRKLPLIVLSADRPSAWIGQLDGQTLPQPGAFGGLVARAVDLPNPEGLSGAALEEAIWHGNRLVNEALSACTGRGEPRALENGLCAPVQINMALSEPLFDYCAPALPSVRRICPAPVKRAVDVAPFAARWQALPRRLVVVGQSFSPADPPLAAALHGMAQQGGCLVFAEHLANCREAGIVGDFDLALAALPPEAEADFAPDLLITLGGHVVSKRLKRFLRAHPPRAHWSLAAHGEIADTFLCMTDLIACDAARFLQDLQAALPQKLRQAARKPPSDFCARWRQAASAVRAQVDALPLPFCEIAAVGALIRALPENAALHLGNSSALRHAQLFALPFGVQVFCNRGTSGIEGSLATALGFAAARPQQPVFLLIGDLSFFYGLNSLWHDVPENLRILLLNNGGGAIFHHLPGLRDSASLTQVTAAHQANAADWARAAGFAYVCATDATSLAETMPDFVAPEGGARLLEVLVKMENGVQAYHDFYRGLRL